MVKVFYITLFALQARDVSICSETSCADLLSQFILSISYPIRFIGFAFESAATLAKNCCMFYSSSGLISLFPLFIYSSSSSFYSAKSDLKSSYVSSASPVCIFIYQQNIYILLNYFKLNF